jgi:hypothetical protein
MKNNKSGKSSDIFMPIDRGESLSMIEPLLISENSMHRLNPRFSEPRASASVCVKTISVTLANARGSEK